MSWSLSTQQPVPPSELEEALESATISPPEPQGAVAEAISEAKEALVALASTAGVADEPHVSASAYGHVQAPGEQVPEHLRTRSTITTTVSGTYLPPSEEAPAEPEATEAAPPEEPPAQPTDEEPPPEAA